MRWLYRLLNADPVILPVRAVILDNGVEYPIDNAYAWYGVDNGFYRFVYEEIRENAYLMQQFVHVS